MSTTSISLSHHRHELSPTSINPQHATTLDQLKQIHAHLTRTSLSLSPHLPSLISSYSNLSLSHALNSFTLLSSTQPPLTPQSTLFVLNSLIRALTLSNYLDDAVHLYCATLIHNLLPDRFTFPPLLTALSRTAASSSLAEGQQFHAVSVKVGVRGDLFTDNSLIQFYARTGDLVSAHKVFDGMPERNEVSWTCLIDGYARGDDPRKAIDLFSALLEEEEDDGGEAVKPNSATVVSVVNACAKLRDLETGVRIFTYVAGSSSGIGPMSVKVVNSFLDMYMKCGEVEKAVKLFDLCFDRDIVSYNTMLTNYAWLGFGNEALGVFCRVLMLGHRPDRVTLLGAVSGCTRLGELGVGRQVHGYITRAGFACFDTVSNSVMDMYVKCGDLDAAFRVFRSMTNKTEASWNTIVNGCFRNGDFDLACRYFDEMPRKNTLSWNTMISARVQASQFKESVLLFREMLRAGVRPNAVTMMSVASACGYLGAIDLAKWVYAYTDKKRIAWDVKLGTVLVDMFAKCGDSMSAMEIFDEMHGKDVFAWTAAIGAMAVEGNGREALTLFNQMVSEGVRPDSIAFVGVLTAFSHGGFVKEGREFFTSMTNVYGFPPEVVHYGCMVDLLGRAGLLTEAAYLVESMPMEPNDVIWGALVFASRVHGDLNMAEYAAKKALELAPERSGIHVLLSNAYALSGKWEDVARVRLDLKEKGIKKPPGSSLIEIGGEIHEFTCGDHSHPRVSSIAEMVDEMSKRISVSGYVPDLANILIDADEAEKEFLLSRHSEKMAVAFGLISSSRGVRIRVVKNLRICCDCHEFMKFVSVVYGREITVRDNKRFHHFQEGKCSCNDYW